MVWRIAAVGIFLALSVPMVAWIQDSVTLLMLGVLLALLFGAGAWWLWRREGRDL